MIFLLKTADEVLHCVVLYSYILCLNYSQNVAGDRQLNPYLMGVY